MTSCPLTTLVVIDPAVIDYQSLVHGVAPDAEVVVLDLHQDGIGQITQVLANRTGIASLHIVSHGQPGILHLGSTQLQWQTLSHYAHQIRQWATGLAEHASILLYGCEVAATQLGQQFVRQLSRLTGAAVAASTNRTGHASLGGDWTLEFATGPVQTSLAFSPQTLAAYPFALAFLDETFRFSDVADKRWRFGVGETGRPTPRDNPFLTARGTAAAPAGGLPGSPTGALDPEGEGTLRLTNALNDQATFVLYDNPIPFNAGLTITFELYAYGSTSTDAQGSGADGVSFFLIDGTASPDAAGAFGGSLGYAQKFNPNLGINVPGIVGGYLGIGFDEFGNFSSPADEPGGPVVRVGGPGRTPDSISVRSTANTQYTYVTGTPTLPFGIDNPTATTRVPAKRTVVIDLTPDERLSVRIDANNDGDFIDPGESPPELQNIDVGSINGISRPDTFKFGFAAGTGDFNNIHEVRNLVVDILNQPPEAQDFGASLPILSSINLTGFAAIDPENDPIQLFTITTLPPAEQGTLFLGDPAAGGVPIVVGQAIPAEEIGQVFFQSTASFTGATFTYTATDSLGLVDGSPATVTLGLIPTPPPGGGDDDGPGVPGLPDGPGDGGVVAPGGCLPGITRRARTDRDTRLIGTRNIDRLTGRGGNDTIQGRDCPDRLDGGRGNDRIAGGAARDRIQGQQGNDAGRGNAGDDVIDLGLGNDRGFGGRGNDRIFGRRGNDRINGKGGDDELIGGRGRDRIVGASNNDILDGQQGNDELKGGRGRDFINGGLGNDRNRGGRGPDVIYARRGRDVLWGGPARDGLHGGKGNDRIAGNTQRDNIFGGFGDDVIIGGGGADSIRTGRGRDRIVYRNPDHGVDRIRDFNPLRDRIDLRRIFRRPEYTSSDRFASYVRIGTGSDGAILRVDGNGDASGGFLRLAILEGVAANALNRTNILT
ncbi:MAG: DUF4347 domain-containing protein [Synechococcales cyanobacterium M58_A2018_015]|nr:DUF4347 domain-containing protein [Synechococcales cyanobacterium M58_A2018_015]